MIGDILRPPPADFPIAIGFTGTRRSMGMPQQRAILELFRMLAPISEFHHGSCVGADAQMHEFVRQRYPDVRIHVWPGPDGGDDYPRGPFYASCVGDVMHEPMNHFARNRDIVKAVNFMIAAPYEYQHQIRGGTWYTVDHALKVGRDGVIVWPNGTIAPLTSKEEACPP